MTSARDSAWSWPGAGLAWWSVLHATACSAAKAADHAVAGKTDHHARPEASQDQAESRADVIARYGSVQAALQPCEWEALLRSGVRRGSTFHAPPNERWTRNIYGYAPEQRNGPARDRAMQAIA